MNVQSIVEKSPAIELVAEQQFATTEEEIPTKYSLKFEQVKSKRFKIPVSVLSHRSISCWGVDQQFWLHNVSDLHLKADSLGEGWIPFTSDA